VANMIINKKDISDLREKSHLKISQEMENIILEKFGREPEGYEYTEQDIYEQIRKMLQE